MVNKLHFWKQKCYAIYFVRTSRTEDYDPFFPKVTDENIGLEYQKGPKMHSRIRLYQKRDLHQHFADIHSEMHIGNKYYQYYLLMIASGLSSVLSDVL